MSEHTESPWIYSHNTVSGGNGSETVAEVYGFDTPEKKANGKLISSAPDLLEALQKIADWEMPATGQFWDKEEKQPMSYAAAYVSNGERDYIKSIAKAAISKAVNP